MVLRSGSRPPLLACFVGAMLLQPAHQADDFTSARDRMVREQIAARGVSDAAVLAAMRSVPRHRFVPQALRGQAYEDHPLPIGEGQTISQPYVVALMTEALKLRAGERALEVGTGSGYQAAVLSAIVKEVFSMEVIPSLADQARRNLEDAGYGTVRSRAGDGYYGWPQAAPFDAIIVTAAANHIPPPLLDQLREGGRLVIPLGPAGYTQTLTRVTKRKDRLEVDQLGSVVFVPMVGEAQKAQPSRP